MRRCRVHYDVSVMIMPEFVASACSTASTILNGSAACIWKDMLEHLLPKVKPLTASLIYKGISEYLYAVHPREYAHDLKCFILLIMTSSNGNVFRKTEGNTPVTGGFSSQRPVARSFDDFFDLCLNKPLSKHSRGW